MRITLFLFCLNFREFRKTNMEEKSTKRKKPSALPSILSLVAVMFFLGLLGTSIIGFKGLGSILLESSSVDIYFNDSISQEEVLKFKSQFDKLPWVKNTIFVSREEGMKQMGEKYDPEFNAYTDVVILPLSVEVYPKSEYASSKFLDQISHELRANPMVESVVYQRNLVESMNKTLKNTQIILGGIAVIFIVMSIILIQSAVRLGIFANRHTIKSMQLVGATNSFIIRPFVLTFIKYSLIAFPISATLVWFIIWQMPLAFSPLSILTEFNKNIDSENLLYVSIFIAIFGVVLSATCSWLSTRKFLQTKIENLY